MLSVSIIIPTYNEAKNLPLLAEEIFNSVNKKYDAEIIFVDDNSPDGTGDIAESLGKIFPVKVIHRSGKLGLGSAVREGFLFSERPIVGVMDADLSHDPSVINTMLEELASSDIVIGSRFVQGSVVENWIPWRKRLSQIGVFLARRLTGVHDPLSGYFFLKRSVIEGVVLDTTGYKILLELLVKGHYKKLKEISYNFIMRKHSTSKLNNKEYLLFLSQLIRYSLY